MRPRAGIAALLALAALMLAAHLAAPIAPRIERLLASATGGTVVVSGLTGNLTGAITARHVELRDANGAWLAIDDLALEVAPKRLLLRELRIDRLVAARVAVTRLPASSGGGQAALPVRVVLDAGHLDRLDIAPEVAGTAVAVTLDATGELGPALDGRFDATAQPVQEPGNYRLAGTLDAASLHLTLSANEPAGGLLARLAGLPEIGALAITATADGPWTSAATRLDLTAGQLRLSASGQVDLAGQASELQVTASAPAMSPRPDLSWRAARIHAHVTGAWARPHATGKFDVDGLAVAGAALDRLDAELSGDLGHLAVQATLAGLRLPGPRPDLFAAAPVVVQADADLAPPDRPVRFELSHPLLDASGTIRTAGPLISADLTLHLPEAAALAPDVHGPITADVHLAGPLDDPSLQAEITGTITAAGLPATAITASLRGHGLPPAATAEATATGTAGRSRVDLTAAVDQHTRVRLTLDARNLGPADTLRLDADGQPEALELHLAAGGAGVQATAAATLDALAQRLTLTAMQATWRDQRLALLAPAHVSLADGAAVDRLLLGLRQATLEVSGRVLPALAMTATLRALPAALADAVMPDLGAEGTIDGNARLTGTLQHPTGTLRLTASGLRLRQGPAAAFPAVTVAANATLAGTTLRLDGTAALATSRITVAGTTALDPGAPMALHAAGTVDLALLDRLLAADGRRVRGRATLDATVTGTPTAPHFAGTLALAGGEVQDVVRGIRVHGISALVRADGNTMRLEHLTGSAGDGTITARGSIGLAPPLPVDIPVTARNASPVASDPFTAVLDGDLAVRGAVADRITTSGTITVRHAEIRVPERQPAGVAVLQVSRRNQPPAPPPAPAPEVALDLTIDAPGRVFVRGRGLDTELFGTMHVRGTVAAPRAQGTFKLRRGTFNLAGQTLAFSSGTIGLDGSGRIDPTLDLTASSSNGGTTATLAITGYASAPKFTLTSTPPLPQDEVLAHLLFGRSMSSLGAFQLAEIGAGLAELSGVDSGLNPIERLRAGLGLDRLSVGSGQGTGTSVEAGRSIAPGVYVGARQRTSGTGTVGTVQVELGHGLKLETDVGTGGNSSTANSATGSGSTDTNGTNVGIVWQFEY